MTNFEKYNFYICDVIDDELCINIYKLYVVFQACHHKSIESIVNYDDEDIYSMFKWLFSECD